MLQQLHIQNIALIDTLTIEPALGFNILTGETGAGKSIIIDAINAILGNRITRELIRTGCDKAAVEAVFQTEDGLLKEQMESLGIEPEEDGTVIVSREFNHAGKNTCRINGRLVTVSVLKSIGERLIDLHGQHDNQSLLKVESHIELLDSFCSEVLRKTKEEYTKLLQAYRRVQGKLKELTGDVGERERKIDLLKFQVEEINKSKLKLNEEIDLEKQKQRLSHSERILGALSNAYEVLYAGGNARKSAYDNIHKAISEISPIVSIDPKFLGFVTKLEEILYQLEDLTEGIRDERDTTEHDPALLEKIEERIDLIHRLKRKYGTDIAEVLENGAKMQQELLLLEGSEKTIEVLEKQLEDMEQRLYAMAQEMNAQRKKAAELIEHKIKKELEELEMKNASFKVAIQFGGSPEGDHRRKYHGNGLDAVEFLISTNAGEPLKPLSKIASGGEMSRIMLAIKTILAGVDKIPTLIFDEIDIGISGKASQKVGEKLAFISSNHQVICVTHLAQIACMADKHFLIEKETVADMTKTQVMALSGESIIQEIARILGGASISDITRKHASEMLRNAKSFKKNKG